MKFLGFRTLGAAGLIAASALAVSSGPASAELAPWTAAGGTYSYKDATDKFCVKANTGDYTISARLVNIDTRYPQRLSPDFKVGDTGETASGNCVSLARAYENTHYRAVVKSSTPRNSGIKERHKFYS